MGDTLGLRVLRFLPKNLLSRAFGWVAARRRPRFLVRPFMRWFVRRFALDLEQAERSFDEYPSLVDLFTRRLRPGARPLAEDPAALLNPVDARVGAFGRIEGTTLLQAKGMEYELAALLGDEAAVAEYRDGWYATLYLSPRDYHHIHSPAPARVRATLYEPGTLWPVNPPAVRTVPRLFAVNERVTTKLDTEHGPVAVVMVGPPGSGKTAVLNEGLMHLQANYDGPLPEHYAYINPDHWISGS